MKYRPFGSTEMSVSEVGMGCWGIGGNAHGNSYGSTDDAESIMAIKKALEMGCNFFDTADVYGHGHSEELLGLALSKVRKNVFIATKVGGAYMYGGEWGNMNFSEGYIKFALEKSLLRLRTDYIDVYQLHNPSLRQIKEGEVFRPLMALQEEGKVKFVGCSVHTLDEGIAALDHVDVVQCVFNMLNPKNFELIETAKRRGVAVIAREPLANGFLSWKISPDTEFDQGDIRYEMPREYKEKIIEIVEQFRSDLKYRKESMVQLALKFVLHFPVSVVIPGCKTPSQAEENMSASDIPDLSEEDMDKLGS